PPPWSGRAAGSACPGAAPGEGAAPSGAPSPPLPGARTAATRAAADPCACSTGGTSPCRGRASRCSGGRFPWAYLCECIGRRAREIETTVRGSAQAAEAVEGDHGGGQGGGLGPEDRLAERRERRPHVPGGGHFPVREPALGPDDQADRGRL